MPEVGSQPSVTAKSRMALIASQKSGALAPASEPMLAIRSKTPPGCQAASEPTRMEPPIASSMVTAASHSVTGIASSTTSSAGRSLRIEWPRSPLGQARRGSCRTAR